MNHVQERAHDLSRCIKILGFECSGRRRTSYDNGRGLKSEGHVVIVMVALTAATA